MKKVRFLFTLLMAIVMMALSPAKAWAEDVTVGDGTSSIYFYPYQGSSTTSSSTVMLYKNQEIRGGVINAIAFDCDSNTPFQTTSVKIYMADTDVTAFNWSFDNSSVNFTQVYSGSPTLCTARGWEKLDLTTKFTHDPSKNLLVAVYKTSSAINTEANYKYHISDNCILDVTGDIESSFSINSFSSIRPNTQFSFDPCNPHSLTHHNRVEATCTTSGNIEYWECDVCGVCFSDEGTTNVVTELKIPKLGHNLDAEKHCSRCGQTITQLEGTVLDVSSIRAPFSVYKDRVQFYDGTSLAITGNLILTGTSLILASIEENPADGQIVLRDLTSNLSMPIFCIYNSNEIADFYVEGNVTLSSTNGGVFSQYCSNPRVSITGTGNLTMNSSDAILSGINNADIDIEGDLVMTGKIASNYSTLLNAKANAITITQTSGSFNNMKYTTLQAKNDIVVECNGTDGFNSTDYNQVYLFQGLSSTEGTVRFRAAIGTANEYCAVKVGDPVPSPSSSAPFAAYTKKIVHTNGFATYYNTLPQNFDALTYNGNRPYLTLAKDMAGNTVFDMDVFESSAHISIYDGYLTNAGLRSCWDGHPVFTGTGSGNAYLEISETLSADNTPILRNLTLNVSASGLSGNNVVATIDGNVSISGSGSAIYSSNSCTITGNGSLTLKGSDYIYSCPDLNIDITGDLVGSNTGAPLNSHNIDFSKLKANSITFRIQAGRNTEHAIFMPTPATTPAASDPSITYTAKVEKKNGYTVWCADYATFKNLEIFTSLDGIVTILDDSKFAVESTPLTLSDNNDLDFSAYANPFSYFYVPSVTYERTTSSTWGTIMMPFELHSNSDVQYYAVTDVDLSDETMTVTPVDVVYPGVPCIFKRLTSENLNLSSSDKTLVTKNNSYIFVKMYWTFNGTYAAKTLDAETISYHYYYISADKFWHATGTVDVKPYRAYFIGEAPASEARAISIAVEEDGTSSIEAVMDVDGNIYDASEAAFDLSGRRISEGQRGLQIKNGRVVMMK